MRVEQCRTEEKDKASTPLLIMVHRRAQVADERCTVMGSTEAIAR